MVTALNQQSIYDEVLELLCDGWGVENIATMTGIEEPAIRNAIKTMRRNGDLEHAGLVMRNRMREGK